MKSTTTPQNKKAKLTVSQTTLLSAAAERPNGSLMPLPENLKGGARKKVIDGLLTRQWITEQKGQYYLTDEGYTAIGKQRPAKVSKQAQVIHLLQRKDGASLDELVEATDWKKHTVRGVLAGALKKKGFTITHNDKRGADRRYFIQQASDAAA